MIFCENIGGFTDGVSKHDNSRQGRIQINQKLFKRIIGKVYIPLPGHTTKIRITLSLFIGGQNYVRPLLGCCPGSAIYERTSGASFCAMYR